MDLKAKILKYTEDMRVNNPILNANEVERAILAKMAGVAMIEGLMEVTTILELRLRGLAMRLGFIDEMHAMLSSLPDGSIQSVATHHKFEDIMKKVKESDEREKEDGDEVPGSQ